MRPPATPDPSGTGPALARARDAVAVRAPVQPQVGIVLGSGLGAVADRLEHRIPYAEIPGMPAPRVPGHAGYLCLGALDGVSVACLQGRSHLYEGHEPATVVFGVRLLAALGCTAVVLTNAAGGIGATLTPGALMLLRDHINLTGHNPLVGANDDALGPRFPDMTHVYDPALGAAARRAAVRTGIALAEGVYAGVLGPSYETPAEIRMLRGVGADAVGMSTVLEAIALRHLGVRVAGISCITNLAAGISKEPLSHDDVRAIADRTGGSFASLLSAFVAEIAREIGPGT